MPGKCSVCGRQMKPLFQSFYCPSDCDRKPASRVDENWDDDKTDPWDALSRYYRRRFG